MVPHPLHDHRSRKQSDAAYAEHLSGSNECCLRLLFWYTVLLLIAFSAAVIYIIIPTLAAFVTRLPHLSTHIIGGISWCWDAPHACWDAIMLEEAFRPTTAVIFDVGHEIQALLDLYTPFLSPDTPLLARPCRFLPHVGYPTEATSIRPDAAITIPDVEPMNDPEAWIFPSTRREILAICTSLAHSSPDRRIVLELMCPELLRRLYSAAEKHHSIAVSLAGPNTNGLWLRKLDVKFLWLLSDLDAITGPSSPHVTLLAAPDGTTQPTDSAAEDLMMSMRWSTAKALDRYLARQGPWQSVNKIIRSTLLSLQQDCIDIIVHLNILFPIGITKPGNDIHNQITAYRTDRSSTCRIWQGPRAGDSNEVGTGPPGQPEGLTRVSPFAEHIDSIISAIGDALAALDTMENGLLRLRRSLALMTSGQWSTKEIVDGVRVITRFELPAPWIISRSIVERLDRMMADVLVLQGAWTPPTYT